MLGFSLILVERREQPPAVVASAFLTGALFPNWLT